MKINLNNFGLESVDVDINIGSKVTESKDEKENLLETEADDTTVSTDNGDEENSDELEAAKDAEEESEDAIEEAEATAEAEEAEEEAEDADADTEALESLKYTIIDIQKRGGADKPSLEMLEVAVNYTLKKYGIESSEIVPSFESYRADPHGESQKMIDSIDIAMEAIKDKVQDLYYRVLAKLGNRAKAQNKHLLSVIKMANSSPDGIKPEFVFNSSHLTSSKDVMKINPNFSKFFNMYVKAYQKLASSLSGVELTDEEFLETVNKSFKEVSVKEPFYVSIDVVNGKFEIKDNSPDSQDRNIVNLNTSVLESFANEFETTHQVLSDEFKTVFNDVKPSNPKLKKLHVSATKAAASALSKHLDLQAEVIKMTKAGVKG